MAESNRWGDMVENGEITQEEYLANTLGRYEIRQCSCGKYTLSWYGQNQIFKKERF